MVEDKNISDSFKIFVGELSGSSVLVNIPSQPDDLIAFDSLPRMNGGGSIVAFALLVPFPFVSSSSSSSSLVVVVVVVGETCFPLIVLVKMWLS